MKRKKLLNIFLVLLLVLPLCSKTSFIYADEDEEYEEYEEYEEETEEKTD